MTIKKSLTSFLNDIQERESMATDFPLTDIDRLTTTQLVELFATLECPTIDEMNGEYAARLLRQPTAFAHLAGLVSVGNPLMPWLVKAFRPVDGESGRGYNTFRQLGRIVQKFPMITRIADSRFDGQPAYHLIYRAFDSMCGDINMVDEVRRLAPGVYLGIGTWGFTDKQRATPLPFLLEATGEPYRGDIGRPRSGFTLGAREIPALTQEKD